MATTCGISRQILLKFWAKLLFGVVFTSRFWSNWGWFQVSVEKVKRKPTKNNFMDESSIIFSVFFQHFPGSSNIFPRFFTSPRQMPHIFLMAKPPKASSSKRGESRDELVNDKDKLLRGGFSAVGDCQIVT